MEGSLCYRVFREKAVRDVSPLFGGRWGSGREEDSLPECVGAVGL